MSEADKLASGVVKERDKNRCRRCKNIGTQAHHLFSRRHSALRWSPTNLVWLCYGCHSFFHREPELARGWIIKELGQQTFDALKVTAYTVQKKTDISMKIIELKTFAEIFKEVA